MSKTQAKDNIISAQEVVVRFSGETIIDKLSFEVARGEFIGLIGPNGAGKTTLVKAILGLTPIDEGVCSVDSDAVVRYVSQQYALPTNVPISVREVVQMGASQSHTDEHIGTVLAEVGMDAKQMTKNFHTLSGGQKQRTIIARALIAAPDMIFFDEPLSGIDRTTKADIYKLLKKRNADGMTIFFVSHDVDNVVDACDRVLCLDRRLHRGCHPVAFAEGQREEDLAVKTQCLVDSEGESHQKEKKLMHHHH